MPARCAARTDAVVAIVEQRSGRVVGTVDSNAAHVQVHPGAVHVHQGASSWSPISTSTWRWPPSPAATPGGRRSRSQSTFELGEAAEMEQAGVASTAARSASIAAR